MHILELTAPERRVLGCLIEKRFTTPDQYPLTLNALRLACNQSTNRDPVTRYDEETVLEAVQRLSKYGVARLASGHSSRAAKFRHLAEEALGLNQEQLAVLCVLLLRGMQTPGELKARTERMVTFTSLEEVDRVLEELGEHGYVRRIERRPGQKEDRFQQLLGGGGGDDDAGASPAAGAAASAPADDRSWRDLPARDDLAERLSAVEPELAARLTAVESDLAELRRDLTAQLAELREELEALRLLWDD
ncbi:MAG: YceH family protein [Solirubrobacteraceae bacterium]